jgi:conjugal transfer/entry exclusion protein
LLARDAFADEMTKILRSGGMSDKEIRSWKDTLNASRSPTELRAVVGHSIELMRSRLAALQDQHERATGRASPQWLPPRSRAALEKIRQWADEQNPE